MPTVQELEATVAALVTENQQLDADNKRALDTIRELTRELSAYYATDEAIGKLREALDLIVI